MFSDRLFETISELIESMRDYNYSLEYSRDIVKAISLLYSVMYRLDTGTDIVPTKQNFRDFLSDVVDDERMYVNIMLLEEDDGYLGQSDIGENSNDIGDLTPEDCNGIL